MYASRPEPPLGDLESTPLAKEHVARRDTHVGEGHFRCSIRDAIEAEYGKRAHYATPRACFGTRIIDWRLWRSEFCGSV
jgi:hypothetical protein